MWRVEQRAGIVHDATLQPPSPAVPGDVPTRKTFRAPSALARRALSNPIGPAPTMTMLSGSAQLLHQPLPVDDRGKRLYEWTADQRNPGRKRNGHAPFHGRLWNQEDTAEETFGADPERVVEIIGVVRQEGHILANGKIGHVGANRHDLRHAFVTQDARANRSRPRSISRSEPQMLACNEATRTSPACGYCVVTCSILISPDAKMTTPREWFPVASLLLMCIGLAR